MFGLALLILSQAATSGAELRAVQVSVTDEKGNPISGLVAEEVAVLENGVARDLASIHLDDRPLTAAILVDTSQAVATALRLQVVDAVAELVRRLPDGSRYTLWTTGDLPLKVVELTDDPGRAAPALRQSFPRGGNTMLDALVEAVRDLASLEGERSALIAITGQGIEFSNRPERQVVEQVAGFDVTFMGVLFREGGGDGDSVRRLDYVFDELSRKTGGLFESPLSSLSVPLAVTRVAGDLAGQYRIRYATLSDVERRKIEVQVARPGVRVRVGASQAVGAPR